MTCTGAATAPSPTCTMLSLNGCAGEEGTSGPSLTMIVTEHSLDAHRQRILEKLLEAKPPPPCPNCEQKKRRKRTGTVMNEVISEAEAKRRKEQAEEDEKRKKAEVKEAKLLEKKCKSARTKYKKLLESRRKQRMKLLLRIIKERNEAKIPSLRRSLRRRKRRSAVASEAASDSGSDVPAWPRSRGRLRTRIDVDGSAEEERDDDHDGNGAGDTELDDPDWLASEEEFDSQVSNDSETDYSVTEDNDDDDTDPDYVESTRKALPNGGSGLETKTAADADTKESTAPLASRSCSDGDLSSDSADWRQRLIAMARAEEPPDGEYAVMATTGPKRSEQEFKQWRKGLWCRMNFGDRSRMLTLYDITDDGLATMLTMDPNAITDRIREWLLGHNKLVRSRRLANMLKDQERRRRDKDREDQI